MLGSPKLHTEDHADASDGEGKFIDNLEVAVSMVML